MSNTVKEVRVGQMPGQINTYAVAVGTPISELLEMAGLSASGFDVKVDSVKVDPATATVTSTTNLVLLAKQIKGNGVKEVRVGQMPGQINTFAVEEGTSIAALLELAGLSATGFDVKVDSVKVDPTEAVVTSSTNLVLLAKQIKGNK